VPSETICRLTILREDKDCTDVDIKPATSVLLYHFAIGFTKRRSEVNIQVKETKTINLQVSVSIIIITLLTDILNHSSLMKALNKALNIVTLKHINFFDIYYILKIWDQVC